MPSAKLTLLALLVLIGTLYIGYWATMLTRRRQWQRPTLYQAAVGLVTDFLDTLGIGSFAITTALYRPFKTVDDRLIPGTLNVGHALPTITQALFFINAIDVDVFTLVSLILASVIGAWLGAGIVARLPKRAVQIGMGTALLVAAGALLARQMGTSAGLELGLTGSKLIVAILGNLLFGALMTIGVGAYAPILVMISLLGMNPKAAFPIMMGSCAFLMPAASWQFIRRDSYSPPAALGLTLLGVPGAILAAVLVSELNLWTVQWLVLAVVIYTSVTMLRSGLDRSQSSESSPSALAP